MDININALESLATKSRARLIGQATGAIQRLLDDPLTEAEDRRRIERAVAHHGGVEGAAREAAYSWFNRLTALRYMDAVGVSGTCCRHRACGRTSWRASPWASRAAPAWR